MHKYKHIYIPPSLIPIKGVPETNEEIRKVREGLGETIRKCNEEFDRRWRKSASEYVRNPAKFRDN